MCDNKIFRLLIAMTPPFLFLLVAAVLFRILSSDSDKAFRRRLASLLPRKVMRDHLRALLEDYPERLAEFRRRVLPFSALHVGWNVAACLCFAAAVWYFPPEGMEHWDLLFVRYGSILLTPLAFVTDAVPLVRLLKATFARGAEADGAM